MVAELGVNRGGGGGEIFSVLVSFFVVERGDDGTQTVVGRDVDGAVRGRRPILHRRRRELGFGCENVKRMEEIVERKRRREHSRWKQRCLLERF